MRIELSTLKGMKTWMDSFAQRTEVARCDVSDPNHDKDFVLEYAYFKGDDEHKMDLVAPNGHTIVQYIHKDLEECKAMFFGMISNECDVGGDPRFPVPESVLDTVTHIIAHTTGLSDGSEKTIPLTENIVMHYIYDEGEYQFMMYGNFILLSTSRDLEEAKDNFLRKLEFIVFGDTDPVGLYAGLGSVLENIDKEDD